ncbi:hypothetical protein TB2_031360 [Malus domestica]
MEISCLTSRINGGTLALPLPKCVTTTTKGQSKERKEDESKAVSIVRALSVVLGIVSLGANSHEGTEFFSSLSSHRLVSEKICEERIETQN